MSGQGISVIETQLNSLNIKRIQKLLNPTNVLRTNFMLYHQLNLILNYNEGLALFIGKNILRSTRHKHLQKQTMKISLFNYTMLGYILPIAISLPLRKEILGQSHIFESTVQTDNLFSVAFQTNLLFFNKDLCRYLQACLL